MAEMLAAQPVITPAPVALANANTAGGSGGKGRICIAARSRIKNLTRAPRLAKALVDAGYDVTIVSLASPGPQLRAMCPEVEYIEVKYTQKTRELANRLAIYRQKRNQLHSKQEKARQAQLVKGGPKALAIRLFRLGQVPLRSLGRLFWRMLVVTPCALLLKKRLEGFASTWRSLAAEDVFQIMTRCVLVPNQWSASYAFAEEADKVTRGRRFDVVQAYDNYGLLAGTRLARRDGAKLIYDAVEITSHRLGATLNLCFAERLCERLQRRQEKRLFGKADAITTVGNGLADWYVRNYRIARPLVVRNCRYYWPYQIDGRLRADAGVGADIRILVWCGLIYPEQGIELLINAMPHLASSIHLAIIGIFNPAQKSYAEEVLPGLAAKLGAAARVHILPAREPNDLVPYISGGDLGVIPRPSEHPNNFYSMPNKFLEMVMARLPVAVSQLGDIARTIDEFQIGATFNERAPAEIAAVIQGMLEPVGYAVLKANVMKAAESLSWEHENPPYVELVTSLMPRRHHGPLVAEVRDNPAVGRPAVGRPARLSVEPRTAAVLQQEAPATKQPTGGQPSTAADRTVNAQEHSRLETEKPGEPVARNGSDDARAPDGNQRPRAAVEQLSKSQAELERLAQCFRQHWAVNVYLRFARFCHERASECKAEAYVAHGVEALAAADAVARAVGGRLYCDVIELPSLAQRSVIPNWHPTVFSMLDHAFDGYLREAAGLSTIGWALKEMIRHYGPPVTVIPNYRYAEELPRSTEIRDKSGLGPDDRLVLASSSIYGGFEAIVEAMRLLPANIHLATLGRLLDPAAVRAMPARFGIQERVHFFDEVPYSQLTTAASGADIGLIALDPTNMNDRISLPDRLFDCIAAGLPIVSPDVPDVARIIEGRGLGITIARNEPRLWATAIEAALAVAGTYRANVRTASHKLVWDSLGDKLHSAYGYAESITFISYLDVVNHRRTARMADALLKRGVKVTVCCPHEGPVPEDAMPGVRFVLTPSPLPRAAAPATPTVAAEPAGKAFAADSPTAKTPTSPDAPAVPAGTAPTPAAMDRAGPNPAVTAAAGNGAAAHQRPEDADRPLSAATNKGPPTQTLALSQTPQGLTRAEEVTLEGLKQEVMALRYKARRFDEIRDELPGWQEKAVRYDELKGRKGGALFGTWRRGSRPVGAGEDVSH